MIFEEIFKTIDFGKDIIVKDAENDHILEVYKAYHPYEDETPYDDLLVTYVSNESDNEITVFVLTDD